MAVFEDGDIQTMLDTWGNTLTAGEISAGCALDDREEIVLAENAGAGQIVRRITATIRTSDFPNLAGGDAIQVDGVAYTVYQRLKLGDGALTELWLRLADES